MSRFITLETRSGRQVALEAARIISFFEVAVDKSEEEVDAADFEVVIEHTDNYGQVQRVTVAQTFSEVNSAIYAAEERMKLLWKD